MRAGEPVDLSVSPEKLVVLGIETSCDDTGAAVVTGDGRILGEALASQVGRPSRPRAALSPVPSALRLLRRRPTGQR